LFATAGIPICTEPRDTENGIKTAKRLGLGAMELEFVQAFSSQRKGACVRQVAESEGIALTCTPHIS